MIPCVENSWVSVNLAFREMVRDVRLFILQSSHPKAQADLGKWRGVRSNVIETGGNGLLTQLLRYAVKRILLNKMYAFVITKTN